MNNIKQLNLIANEVRQDVVKMIYEAKSGHSAGSIGLADIFVALYSNVLYHDPDNPDWPERDRFVLSNGHVCPVLYAVLANSGYFPKEELMTLRKLGTRLQGHPHRTLLPGIETSSGPLGQGLSQAIGMALVAKTEKKKSRVYCMVSDGEQQEGQSWEAAMLAAKLKLGNLTVIMDRNNIQIDGYTEDVMPLEPLAEKFKSFGWHVIDIDGHNIQQIINACNESRAVYEKPTMIIAHTIPGKAVSFMEYSFEWHGKPPSKEDMEKALKELENMKKLIEEGEA
ncbi:transketolase [Candidatus Micrarchaeota archaeon]|nr:transketolase [Candidatus Micrarchaeota archaeon]MBU1681330.1 transketolase [Candidatus Micrarchaeota archaeon]